MFLCVFSRRNRPADEPTPCRHRGRPRPSEVRQAGPASLRACPGSMFGHSQTEHPTVQQLCFAVCLKGRGTSLSPFISLLLPPSLVTPPCPSFSPFSTQGPPMQLAFFFCHFLLLLLLCCVGSSPSLVPHTEMILL